MERDLRMASNRWPRPGAPARTRWISLTGAALLLLATWMVGCSGGGVRWDFGRFEDVHARGRTANKLTFVYFRNWYSKDCYHFEEDILKHSQVLPETRKMICVPLEYDYDRHLAESWGLSVVPAYAIVAPGGTVVAKDEAPITLDELLAALRGAQEEFAARAGASKAPG